MRQAMKRLGSTQQAVVEEGLRLLIKLKGQEGVRRSKGKIRLAENGRELNNGKECS